MEIVIPRVYEQRNRCGRDDGVFVQTLICLANSSSSQAHPAESRSLGILLVEYPAEIADRGPERD